MLFGSSTAIDVDNKPVITPFAILNTNLNHSTAEPRLMVLMQWTGLHPNDTSWEEWASVKGTYHLGDKVLFDGLRDDRQRTMVQQDTRVGSERLKRKINPPKHLEDYV